MRGWSRKSACNSEVQSVDGPQSQIMVSWTSAFLPVDACKTVSRVDCIVRWRRRQFFECGVPVLQFGSESVFFEGQRRQCSRVGKTFEVCGRHTIVAAIRAFSHHDGLLNCEETFVTGVLYKQYSLSQAGGSLFQCSRSARSFWWREKNFLRTLVLQVLHTQWTNWHW